MSRRPWIKINHTWFNCDSHRDLNGDEKCRGVRLLVMADADPRWRERGYARLMNADGSPMSVDDIARIAELRRDSVSRVVRKLVEAGTLVRGIATESGLQVVDKCSASDEQVTSKCIFLIFPNYGYWQGKQRLADRPAQVENLSLNQEKEEDQEKEYMSKSGDFDARAKSEKQRKAQEKREVAAAANAERRHGLTREQATSRVCRWIYEARRRCGIASSLPKCTADRVKHVNDRIAAGADLADWWTVIERQALANRGDKKAAAKYLTIETLHRPTNFDRLLSWDHIPVPPMPAVAGPDQDATEAQQLDPYWPAGPFRRHGGRLQKHVLYGLEDRLPEHGPWTTVDEEEIEKWLQTQTT